MSSMAKSMVIFLFCISLGALTGCQSTTGKTASQTINDAAITTAVEAELTSDRLSDFPRINVDTERGVVSLGGVVWTEDQRVRAERLAHQVKGVVKVKNKLQVYCPLPKCSPF